ncbi:MAG: Hpt domain-containing protein [Rhodopirellula sp.]|nr:Hpt domain-containing protein [Rhodopirellula sp.]
MQGTLAELDRKPLYSTLAGDPDLDEIVTLFVEEMPARVEGILQNLDRRNWEMLRRLAHQLKGSAGGYGFESISKVAARVETAVYQSLPEEVIQNTVEELVELCGRATV